MLQEAYRIKNTVGHGRLCEAVDAVVERHAVLRTRFVQPSGKRMLQVVLHSSPSPAVQRTSVSAMASITSPNVIAIQLKGDLELSRMHCDADEATYLVWSIHPDSTHPHLQGYPVHTTYHARR
jgi:hypothetical protein